MSSRCRKDIDCKTFLHVVSAIQVRRERGQRVEGGGQRGRDGAAWGREVWGVTYMSLAGLGFTTFSALKQASMISLKPAFPTFLASCGAHTHTRTDTHTHIKISHTIHFLHHMHTVIFHHFASSTITSLRMRYISKTVCVQPYKRSTTPVWRLNTQENNLKWKNLIPTVRLGINLYTKPWLEKAGKKIAAILSVF